MPIVFGYGREISPATIFGTEISAAKLVKQNSIPLNFELTLQNRSNSVSSGAQISL